MKRRCRSWSSKTYHQGALHCPTICSIHCIQCLHLVLAQKLKNLVVHKKWTGGAGLGVARYITMGHARLMPDYAQGEMPQDKTRHLRVIYASMWCIQVHISFSMFSFFSWNYIIFLTQTRYVLRSIWCVELRPMQWKMLCAQLHTNIFLKHEILTIWQVLSKFTDMFS